MTKCLPWDKFDSMNYRFLVLLKKSRKFPLFNSSKVLEIRETVKSSIKYANIVTIKLDNPNKSESNCFDLLNDLY